MRLKSLVLAMATVGSFLVATVGHAAYNNDCNAPRYKGCPTPSYCSTGAFYVGGTIGAKAITTDTDIDVGLGANVDFGPFDGDFLAVLDSDIDGGNAGASGTLYIGYGMNLNNFYLGFEANAEFNNITVENETTVSVDPLFDGNLGILETELSVKDSVGLSILPGYRFTDNSLFYTRLGIIWGRITSEVDGVSGENNDSFTKLGGQVGLGMEYSLTRQLSVRAEYVYTWYQSVDTDADTSLDLGGFIDSEFGIADVDLFTDVEHTIRSNAFNLGLTYRFV